MARVGFEMQRRRSETGPGEKKDQEILATGEQVRSWIAAAMAESGQSGNEVDAAEFVEYLGKRSGLLLPRGHDRFAFLHLSFQEYFAACLLAQRVVTPAWIKGDNTRMLEGARQDDLREHANRSLWRETLVFLIQLLAIDHQDWLLDARDCLFGPNFSAVQPTIDHWNRVLLLARLVIDPYAGFDSRQKEEAIRVCCRYEMMMQKEFESTATPYDNMVVRTLLSIERTSRDIILEQLVAAAHEAQSPRLDLSGTGVTNISTLTSLPQLRYVNLKGTAITDISPLGKLVRLGRLDLSGTQVCDFSPLRNLKYLSYLGLNHTKMDDLSSLAGLLNLTTLGLSHTGVSDLGPLTRLPQLQNLDVTHTRVSDLSPLARISTLSCISISKSKVSKDMIASFQKRHPSCKVEPSN
ncbi:MAG: leucine-rich repeat domain-containing protein [Planctomycetota bacterium]